MLEARAGIAVVGPTGAAEEQVVDVDARILILNNRQFELPLVPRYSRLVGLVLLCLDSNGLDELPSAMLTALPSLRYLFARDNGLRSLDWGVLEQMTALQVLDISENAEIVLRGFDGHLRRGGQPFELYYMNDRLIPSGELSAALALHAAYKTITFVPSCAVHVDVPRVPEAYGAHDASMNATGAILRLAAEYGSMLAWRQIDVVCDHESGLELIDHRTGTTATGAADVAHYLREHSTMPPPCAPPAPQIIRAIRAPQISSVNQERLTRLWGELFMATDCRGREVAVHDQTINLGTASTIMQRAPYGQNVLYTSYFLSKHCFDEIRAHVAKFPGEAQASTEQPLDAVEEICQWLNNGAVHGRRDLIHRANNGSYYAVINLARPNSAGFLYTLELNLQSAGHTCCRLPNSTADRLLVVQQIDRRCIAYNTAFKLVQATRPADTIHEEVDHIEVVYNHRTRVLVCRVYDKNMNVIPIAQLENIAQDACFCFKLNFEPYCSSRLSYVQLYKDKKLSGIFYCEFLGFQSNLVILRDNEPLNQLNNDQLVALINNIRGRSVDIVYERFILNRQSMGVRLTSVILRNLNQNTVDRFNTYVNHMKSLKKANQEDWEDSNEPISIYYNVDQLVLKNGVRYFYELTFNYVPEQKRPNIVIFNENRLGEFDISTQDAVFFEDKKSKLYYFHYTPLTADVNRYQWACIEMDDYFKIAPLSCYPTEFSESTIEKLRDRGIDRSEVYHNAVRVCDLWRECIVGDCELTFEKNGNIIIRGLNNYTFSCIASEVDILPLGPGLVDYNRNNYIFNNTAIAQKSRVIHNILQLFGGGILNLNAGVRQGKLFKPHVKDVANVADAVILKTIDGHYNIVLFSSTFERNDFITHAAVWAYQAGQLNKNYKNIIQYINRPYNAKKERIYLPALFTKAKLDYEVEDGEVTIGKTIETFNSLISCVSSKFMYEYGDVILVTSKMIGSALGSGLKLYGQDLDDYCVTKLGDTVLTKGADADNVNADSSAITQEVLRINNQTLLFCDIKMNHSRLLIRDSKGRLYQIHKNNIEYIPSDFGLAVVLSSRVIIELIFDSYWKMAAVIGWLME